MGMIEYTHCCGVADYEGLNEPGWTFENFLQDIAIDDSWLHCLKDGHPATAGAAHYFMAIAVDKGNKTGPRSKRWATKRLSEMKAYVKKHNMGTLIISDWKGNPNHAGDTEIKSIIFTPNRTSIYKWVRKEYADEIKTARDYYSSWERDWINANF